jgi:hypothetical protein
MRKTTKSPGEKIVKDIKHLVSVLNMRATPSRNKAARIKHPFEIWGQRAKQWMMRILLMSLHHCIGHALIAMLWRWAFWPCVPSG